MGFLQDLWEVIDFQLSSKRQIDSVKIIDGGEGYSNRKLIVKPTGISTIQNTINFDNHGFNDGELVTYDYQTTQISGISTTNQYYVLKLDDDSFRLCDAGIGGTNTSNYERGNYETFRFYWIWISIFFISKYFSFYQIYNCWNWINNSRFLKELVTTPVVKGSIIDGYVYEGGTGYGSTIINYENKPTITVQNGKLAQLNPVVVGGKISSVSVSYGGTEYYSVPDLVVSGTGIGAELRAIIVSDGKISEVKVINAGIGYSSSNTSIEVIASGQNVFIDPQIRKLTVNDNHERFSTGEVLLSGNNKLQYSVSKYFTTLRNSFLEDSGSRSGIIGWAYDGNPIYGPYGYPNPETFSGGKNY